MFQNRIQNPEAINGGPSWLSNAVFMEVIIIFDVSDIRGRAAKSAWWCKEVLRSSRIA